MPTFPVPDSLPTAEVFGINAVSRLTGISPHLLRIWERRYQVVDPGRSHSKRREYNREDIRRLTLIKALVDRGHSIGTVASLSAAQLESRLREADPGAEASSRRFPALGAKVALAGPMFRDAMRDAADETPGLQIVGEFMNLADLRASLRPGAADILVLEIPVLFEEQVAAVQESVSDLGARRAIVIYRFAKSDVVGPLDKDLRGITAMRAPVNAAELRLACTVDLSPAAIAEAALSQEPAAALDLAESLGDIPPRQFSDAELARLARLPSAVQCECPQHLASLLSSLSAFEIYSAECESRNEEDARLHAYLHRATAMCRAEMEQALRVVLDAEGIALSSPGPA